MRAHLFQAGILHAQLAVGQCPREVFGDHSARDVHLLRHIILGIAVEAMQDEGLTLALGQFIQRILQPGQTLAMFDGGRRRDGIGSGIAAMML